MTAIDLLPDHRAIVEQILGRHVPGCEVRIFGSRVTGRARPFSDLDLVIMTGQPIEVRAWTELRDAFSESRLPFVVDVLDWSGLSEAFRKRVEETAVTLIDAEGALPG